ncbi:MAG: chromate transporter [Rikenellaceae bacterium]|nr:chromate transporter [Rikenellaceae bacterium]
MRQLAEIFFTFFRIGLFTFGGGFAMIALIQRAIIERKKWIDEKTFMELLIIAQSSPGPIAINTAVFVGYKHKGVPGAFAAALGTIVPSFVIILLIAIFFASIRENIYVDAAFKGMRPTVVALIVGPVISLSRNMGWWKIVIAAFIGWALWYWGFSPILPLMAGALIGIGVTAYNAHKKIDKR